MHRKGNIVLTNFLEHSKVKNIGEGKSTVKKGGMEDLKIHKPANFPELVVNLLINPYNKCL